LAKLRSLGVLDTEAEDRFDRIAMLASAIAGMPIAAISLVDEKRQFFKSICGLDTRETPRDQAFCAYTILSNDFLVVHDATTDLRFRDNALVTGPPHIRAYAGVPLVVDGLCMGSLCVIDLQPNTLSVEQLNGLRTLAEVTASELANRALRREAESASRAKSMFLANMSHEIRSPLSVISGYAEVLADDSTAPEKAQEAIRAIEQNANHLLQLVSGILDLSKIEANRFQVEQMPLRPSEVVSQAVEMLTGEADRSGIRVLSTISRTDSVVLGDPTRLRQIAVNLIANAIKFSGGNDIEVVLDCDCPSDSTAHLRLTVRDRGIGMSAEQLERVFDEFQQADPSSTRLYGGTGLGLAIVRRLVDLLGGMIGVESVPGGGTTFVVDFVWPRAGAQTASARPDRGAHAPAKKSSDRTLSGLRILLAEDGPDNQRLISHFLRKAGAEVEIVSNGEDAWRSVTGSAQTFDCVLMDIQMPIMDGCEATRRIRAAGCETPILALTANTLSETMDECLRAGCNHYAQKPIRRDDLIERIATLAGTERRAPAA
jgi:signal transduction histidine kinase/ActR/RegA family two-component response regulator